MTKAQARALVGVAKAAYPRQQLAAATLELYANAWLDLSYPEAQRAMAAHIASSQWWPTVADLRMLVAEEQLHLPQPAAAWELVQARANARTLVAPCEACRATGYEEGWLGVCAACKGTGELRQPPQVVLPEPVARALASVGGVHAVRNAAGDQVGVLRGQFHRAYQEYRAEALRYAQLPPAALPPGHGRALPAA